MKLNTTLFLGLFCISATFSATLSTACAEEKKAEVKNEKKVEGGEKWVSLFNGKDLTGWTPKFKGHDLGVNFNDTFRVEDGILKVCYDKYDKWDNNFGHLFYKEEFSHYRLRVEYRFVGKQCDRLAPAGRAGTMA